MPKSKPKAKSAQPRRANPNRSRARPTRPTPDAPRRNLPQAARGVADSLLHARAPEAPPWKYLPLILALAFAARAAVALHGDFTLHPDEIMQYLEPAHNLVFGNGVLHWEFFYGARAWLLPGLVAGVLALFDLIGLGETLWYIEAVKLLFCAISLLIPAGMYFFARRHFSETAARVALLAGAFWYELVGFAHKPMSEFNATALLLVLLALCVRPPSAWLIWPLAALAVLAAALRLQYAPIALLLLGMAFIRSDHKLHLLIASALLLLALGVFDAVTWDAGLFHSYLTNIRYNLSFPFLADSGSPFYKYAWWLTLATAALGPLCIAASLRRWRRYGLLLALIAVVLLLHSAQAHQEYRFIFFLTPLWLLIGADLLARAGARVKNPRPRLCSWRSPAAACSCSAGPRANLAIGFFSDQIGPLHPQPAADLRRLSLARPHAGSQRRVGPATRLLDNARLLVSAPQHSLLRLQDRQDSRQRSGNGIEIGQPHRGGRKLELFRARLLAGEGVRRYPHPTALPRATRHAEVAVVFGDCLRAERRAAHRPQDGIGKAHAAARFRHPLP